MFSQGFIKKYLYFYKKIINLKITFLGTGTSQGIPVVNSSHPVCLSTDPRDKRLRVSLLVEWNDNCFVIDCGPDFRYQMLRAEVKKIDAVLITHEHADHVAGLDDLRPFSFQMGAVPVYAQRRVMKNLEHRFEYIFSDEKKYPGAPSVKKFVIDKQPFNVKGIEVVPVDVIHGQLNILGFRFNKMAYLTDVKKITAKEQQKLQQLDVLILSAIRHEPHHSHLNLNEALELIENLQPKKTYLTHISHHGIPCRS